MKFVERIVSPIVLILVLGAVANVSNAQELRRYQPSRPTVSPYLNLDRANAGGLPNYYSLVRPLKRQGQVNQQTQRLQRQQAASLQQLERAGQRRPMVPTAATGTGSQFMTPSNRAVYRDTLQFYPMVNLRRR